MRSIALTLMILAGACGEVTATYTDGGAFDATSADASIEPDSAEPVSAACGRTPSCGEAGEVADLDDLQAILELCPTWGSGEIDSALNRTATFRVTTGFRICPEDLPLPADCIGGSPLCNAGVQLDVDAQLTGVAATVACNGAQLEPGARFRIRYDVRGPTQGNPLRTARIQLERPCDGACVASEQRCDVNQACYDANALCFACGRGTREQCACRTPDNGVLPDCTSCSVLYDDFISLGQCVAGACDNDACDQCPCR